MMRAAVAALAGSVAWVGVAAAQEPAPEQELPTVTPPEALAPAGEPEKKADAEDQAEKKEKKKDDKKLFYGDIDVGGRVFYRLDAEHLDLAADDRWSFDHELASARIEVTWRWQWLRVVLEAELEGKVRDAYARGKWGAWEVQAGNFKPPTSVFELESAFNLPMTSRGFLNDVLVDRMQIGGRRPGVQVEWTGAAALQPQVRVGSFQPSYMDGTLIDRAEIEDTNVAARASIEPGDLEVAVFGETLTTRPFGTSERYWMAGADATYERLLGGGGVRAWADLQLGNHGFQVDVPGETREDTFFLASRVAAAWRKGGVEEGSFYVEPYAYVGFMDPDDRFSDDAIMEGALGVNLGAWRRVRVALEASVLRVDQPPARLDPSAVDELPTLVDRELVRLFVGARF